MTATEEPTVTVERPRDGVAVVRFNRPERLNALVPEMVDRFAEQVRAAGSDRSVRAIIVTGAGRGFCAGLDITAFVGRDGVERTSVDRFDNQERFAAMVRAVRSVEQPVIAAVNGPVAGAGLGVALGADIRVAADSAVFHVAAVKIGLSAGECGISWHLPRLIGMSRAMEIMLTGRPVQADEAERIGLVSRVVPAEQVLEAAMETAAAIAANSPFAVRMTKRVAWTNLGLTLEDALEMENRTQILAVTTDDSREAMRAFAEKRAAVYTGR